MTSEKEGTHEIAIPNEREQSPPPEKNYVYVCPFCEKSITTSIASGHVDHRRVCGKQFRVQDGVLRPTAHFSHTCKAPKNLGESKANTNNPMVARAAERNGMQSNNKEARSMKTCNKKTGSQIITCRRTTTCPGNHFPWRKHQGSEWLLAASCYWRWLLATSYVHLLRALA